MEATRLVAARHEAEAALTDPANDHSMIRVLHLGDLLYPQYDYQFPTIMLAPAEESALIASAKKLIAEDGATAVEPVLRRWQEIADGHFPPFVLDRAKLAAYKAHLRRWMS